MIPYSRRCSRDVQPAEVLATSESQTDTTEAESEYFSVLDGGDFVPVEKHSRSQSFALSNGVEYLSCLDEEELHSECSEDSYELYVGYEEDEDDQKGSEGKAVDPPASQKSWLR